MKPSHVLRGLLRKIIEFYDIPITIEGGENVPKNKRAIIIANHQSLIDGPLIFQIRQKDVFFILKKEARSIPFMGKAMEDMDFIFVDRERPSPKLLKQVAQRLDDERLLAMFPEGTRTPDGEIKEFKRGFAYFAYKLDALIVPAVIVGTYEVLPKQNLIPKIGKVGLFVYEPIEPSKDLTELTLKMQEFIKEKYLKLRKEFLGIN